jgi:HK97 gp10 family phage protein
MAFGMRLEGDEKLLSGLVAGQQAVGSEARTAMETSLTLIEATARSIVPQDTRALMGSINHTISGAGGSLRGEVGPSTRYGFFVEHGRGPGKPPPVAAIEGWARRHGANPFLVARAIGRRGTKPRPFMKPALEKNLSRIQQEFAKIGAKVVARINGG